MSNTRFIFEREYLERVKKKSFLLATILTPLIFPAIIGLVIYLTTLEDNGDRNVEVIDESGYFTEGFNITDIEVTFGDRSIEDAKQAVNDGDLYGVLHIPKMELGNPEGISFYSKTNPGFSFLGKFRRPINDRIEDLKMEALNLDKEVIDQIRTSIAISTFNITESGESRESDTGVASGLGYAMAFLTYMFVFIYGSFIMQSVLNEKTSKIVEIIVSSVKPTQLMLGKVLANGAVALTQFGIWILLITTITMATSALVGYDPREAQQQMVEERLEMAQEMVDGEEIPPMLKDTLDTIYSLPVGQIIGLFLFYFIGGFLLYGALFAAVGSAVDSIQEAQQFMLPVSLPIILSIMLVSVVLQNPDGGASVALSMIPFTSPILMMTRVPFGVPGWQIIISMILLVGGFLFTLWLAGRIYRVGILTSGSKVTYKTLAKWFLMKNY